MTAAVVVTGFLLAAGSTARAATITVTSLADGGAGSLRAAVATAAAGDTIDFAVSGTIALTTGPILIDKTLTITGPGPAAVTIDGGGTQLLLRIQNGVTKLDVAVSGLTLTNSGGGLPCIESGIGNDQSLHIADCVFSNCISNGFGGAIHADGSLVVGGTTFADNSGSWGGAIYCAGDLSVRDSTFTGNDSANFGAAVFATGRTATIVDSYFAGNDPAGAGGVVSISNITGSIIGTTFTGNASGASGAVESDGVLAIANCTFSNEGGVGIRNSDLMSITGTTLTGGTELAVLNTGTLYMTDSTITGNNGGINNEGAATIANCTIADNDALFELWGGVRNGLIATTVIRNTIVADNTPANCLGLFGSTFTSEGYNIDSGTSCDFAATGDLANTAPMLGPLAANGGPTSTRAPLAGSPALDAGNPATAGSGGAACDPGDQRGVPRASGPCDIGAVEATSCGNGTLDPGEGCDDGNLDPNDGCTARCSICGDDVVDAPEETCDDGNLVAGDGCGPGCQLELDHFMCYQAKTTSGTPAFVPVPSVSVVTALESTDPQVKKPQLLCNPASKFGEDPYAVTHPDHLEGYGLKKSPTDPAFTQLAGVPIVNQFGTVAVDVQKRARFRVPTAKSLHASPAAPNPALDHFACYQVKQSTNPVIKKTFVPVVDQFGIQIIDIGKPAALCLPADKNGESPGAENHPGHLLCYAFKRSKQTPKFVARDGVFVHNQFGPERLDVTKPYVFCVPSLRDPVAESTPTPTATVTPTPTATPTPPRFVDNGDDTITDNQTGLRWEKKTGTFTGLVNCTPNPPVLCPDPHHVNNAYQWCAGTFPTCTNPSNPPDGGAFTVFLPALAGFAGFSDWRLPTITELESIVDLTVPGCGTGGSCLDPIFGPVANALYWSSTTNGGNPAAADGVSFPTGATGGGTKANRSFVRAVRGP